MTSILNSVFDATMRLAGMTLAGGPFVPASQTMINEAINSQKDSPVSLTILGGSYLLSMLSAAVIGVGVARIQHHGKLTIRKIKEGYICSGVASGCLTGLFLASVVVSVPFTYIALTKCSQLQITYNVQNGYYKH